MDPRGTGKAIFFLSEYNADILHLSRDHLSKCGDVTEAELIMTMSVTTQTPYHLPKAHTLGRFYRAPKSSQITSLAGKHVINFQMAVEICFLFDKTIILLLSDRVSVISFAGFGYFF